MQVIDRLVILRLSLLLGYVISLSAPFSRLITFFLKPSVFSNFIEPLATFFRLILGECMEPIMSLMSLFWSLLLLSYDLITPIIILLFEILKLLLSIGKLILYTPSVSLFKLLVLIKDGIIGLAIFAKEAT